jgi:hypothetical protein
MEPSVAIAIVSKGNDGMALGVGSPAESTSFGTRTNWVAIEPLRNTAFEGDGLGVSASLDAIDFGSAGAPCEESLPVLRGPVFFFCLKEGDDRSFVTPDDLEHSRRRLPLGVEDQIRT